MKSIACALVMGLFLLSLIMTRSTTAQTAGSAASGFYRFILEDDLTKSVEFDAITDDRGVTTGFMTFTDDARISDIDTDSAEGRPVDGVPFYMKAELDTLTVEKNRALMSGAIRDSSVSGYIGRWVQLVVEDNGDNFEVPDKLTWRFCRPVVGGWVPSDAEVPGDRGAWMSWWATDAERKSDVGIPSKNLIPDEMTRCEVFPLWQYSFVEIKRGEGSIQIRQ